MYKLLILQAQLFAYAFDTNTLMKKVLHLLICFSGFTLFGCGLFSKTTETSCPARTNIIGAEKLLTVDEDMRKTQKDPNVTEGGAKTDPVTGKVTSRKKGLRTGEIEKKSKVNNSNNPYMTDKEKEKDHLRITDKERKKIVKQMKKDMKEFGKETVY